MVLRGGKSEREVYFYNEEIFSVEFSFYSSVDQRGGGPWTKSRSIFLYIKGSLLGLGLLGIDLVGFWVEIGRNLVKSWLILITWIMKSLEII